MLELTKKGYPTFKTKKKLKRDGRKGVIDKISPIPAMWMTYKLESNKIKEVLTLL